MRLAWDWLETGYEKNNVLKSLKIFSLDFACTRYASNLKSLPIGDYRKFGNLLAGLHFHSAAYSSLSFFGLLLDFLSINAWTPNFEVFKFKSSSLTILSPCSDRKSRLLSNWNRPRLHPLEYSHCQWTLSPIHCNLLSFCILGTQLQFYQSQH